jgi:hypothetical protein
MSELAGIPKPPPRMLAWAFISAVLVVAAYLMQELVPGSVLAVTLYKAHLLALGGWGGYWLDRALFPYDRPHEYLEPEHLQVAPAADAIGSAVNGDDPHEGLLYAGGLSFGHAMIRRAIVVAACLVCVGLGA